MRLPPFHWWRTVFWLIPAISVYTLVLGMLSLVSMLVDRRGRLAHGCARAWSRWILGTTGVRVDARGLDRVERDRSYIFVSNHQSIYDIPVLFASIPAQLRIIAKASLGAFPVIGWHLRWTGHLLVDRKRAGVTALGQVARMIERGDSLIVFPEGTRSRDGRVARFKRGLFLLAIEAGADLVPVAVSGTRHVMLKGRLMTCPGDVSIVVHDPIPTGGLTRDDVTRLAEQAQGVVSATVAELEGR
ncbi:MAG: 1-acyl-sn-glycerol-3-phosphate acyltransferase [Acidobacteria bacterium]|nr:1-acyl-sn-glycerol-3-phosphate acyltransferase [Acidobacteriota bacterium]